MSVFSYQGDVGVRCQEDDGFRSQKQTRFASGSRVFSLRPPLSQVSGAGWQGADTGSAMRRSEFTLRDVGCSSSRIPPRRSRFVRSPPPRNDCHKSRRINCRHLVLVFEPNTLASGLFWHEGHGKPAASAVGSIHASAHSGRIENYLHFPSERALAFTQRRRMLQPSRHQQRRSEVAL